MQMDLVTSEITAYVQNSHTNVRTGMDFYTQRTEDREIKSIN